MMALGPVMIAVPRNEPEVIQTGYRVTTDHYSFPCTRAFSASQTAISDAISDGAADS